MASPRQARTPDLRQAQVPAESPEPEFETINGQQVVRVDSPLANWPGHIYVPRGLNAEQYSRWWEIYQVNGGDSRPELPQAAAIERIYRERRHIVIKSHITSVESFDEDMPYLALMNLVVAATQPLIMEARFLPNLPGWWSNTTTGSETDETA
jgi:hypothetical protein